MNNCRHRRWSNGFFVKVLSVVAIIGGWVYGSAEFFWSALILAVLGVGQSMRCCESECMVCESESMDSSMEDEKVYARKSRSRRSA